MTCEDVDVERVTLGERARDIVESCCYVLPPICDGTNVVPERLVPLLTNALSAAVAEEREACEDDYDTAMTAEGVSKYQREHIHEIVDQRAAIRARGGA